MRKEGCNTWATTHKRSRGLTEEDGIIRKDLNQNTNAIFRLFLSEKCCQKYDAAFSFNSQDLCTLVAFETAAVLVASATRAHASSGASPAATAGSPHGVTQTLPLGNGAAASPGKPSPLLSADPPFSCLPVCALRRFTTPSHTQILVAPGRLAPPHNLG